MDDKPVASFWRYFCFCLLASLLACKPSDHSGAASSPGTPDKAEPISRADRKDREARFKWNLATLAGDYDKNGTKDPKWDRPVREALTIFARARSYGPEQEAGFPKNLADAVNMAVDAGCNDPMVKYLHLRFCRVVNDTNEMASAFRDVCNELLRSDYSAVRKFYGCMRAAEARYHVSGRPRRENPDSIAGWNIFKRAHDELISFLADKTAPEAEVDEACHDYLKLASHVTGDLDFVFGQIEAPLFANRPKSSVPYLLKGECYQLYAWAARGNGMADTVTPDGWKGFAERLAVAEAALDQAWKINPHDARIANAMMAVELGQGKGRERMELWFQRAMAIAPNYYDACSAKLYYLEPKWHGSPDDMLAFGRECVASEKWQGWVPLILKEAHDSLAKYAEKAKRTNYWTQAEVWPDIKASFDKFFTLNPEAVNWRQTYARYAYSCEQWDAFKEQVKLAGDISYEYFGGRDEFDKMMKTATEHGKAATEGKTGH